MKSFLNILVTLTLVASAAQATLSKQDRKQIKKDLKSGDLYLRMDMPCATGRHPYGTYVRPLIEVSPNGAENEAEEGVRSSWWHADSTYWGVSVNDHVVFDDADIEAEDGTVEIVLMTADEENETAVMFVGIHSYEDFKAAFDHTFATKPLQEEHDDWSAEIKQAIANRALQNGMTKRQVFYITGAPENFEKSEDGGKKIEVWHLRQDKGVKMGFWTSKSGETTGLPKTIRFEDGKLASSVKADSGFSLDDN